MIGLAGKQVAALVKGALDVTLATTSRTATGRFAPPPIPPAGPDAFLVQLRRDFPDWAIVADVRGGRWAAANGAQEIWRCNGIELRQALIAATGRRGPI